jgi:hypothetical protein
MNGDMRKIKRIMLITTVTIIAVIVLGLSILNVLVYPKQTFVVVDTTALITKQAQQVVAQYPKGKIAADELQKIAERLRESVAIFAQQHHLVILAKGAVWGGNLPDYTDVLLKNLTSQQQRNTEG